MLSFLAQDFFFARLYIVLTVITVIAAFVCSFRQSVIACQLLDRLASVISPNASSNTVWWLFSEPKFSRKIVLFNDSFVVFRPKLCSVSEKAFFCWSVCELKIICPFRFLLKFLLSNCYVIAMSCDLLLCPCYVIALRMLCFCFALIIYCKLQARYRPYTFEDKMRTFFSSVYGRVPKGNSLCNPDAVLRTFKITTASPCSLVNASRHRIKIRSRSPFQPGCVQLLHAKGVFWWFEGLSCLKSAASQSGA